MGWGDARFVNYLHPDPVFRLTPSSVEKVRFILTTAAQPRSETRWTQRFLFKIHFRTLRSSCLRGESHCWENMSKDGLKFVPFQAGPIYLTQ